MIKSEIQRYKNTSVGANNRIQSFLLEHNSTPLKSGSTLAELLARPELNIVMLTEIDDDRPSFPDDVLKQVEIEIKYEGYIKRQISQVEAFKKMEGKKLPDDIDYDDVGSLRLEARAKLKALRPSSVGQASRISGVSPADISVLLVYLEHIKNGNK